MTTFASFENDAFIRTGGNRRTGKKLDQELKRTGGNKRTGEKNLSNKINVQDIINVQGKITSNSFFSLIGKVSDIFRT